LENHVIADNPQKYPEFMWEDKFPVRMPMLYDYPMWEDRMVFMPFLHNSIENKFVLGKTKECFVVFVLKCNNHGIWVWTIEYAISSDYRECDFLENLIVFFPFDGDEILSFLNKSKPPYLSIPDGLAIVDNKGYALSTPPSV
jgi:hypothetical protein